MKTGEIHQVFSSNELDQIVKVMSALPLTKGRNDTQDYQSTRGIGPEHNLFTWFVKKYFTRVQECFPERRIGLSMVKYNDGTEPEKLHSDYYTNRAQGQSFRTLLIPVAVNHSQEQIDTHPVHTIIFNEVDRCTLTKNFWSDRDWINQRQPKANNALQYKDQYLSHLKTEDLECLTVKEIWKWVYGSMFYWDEELLHTSDNFTKNNIKSKQALVMHTHVL